MGKKNSVLGKLLADAGVTRVENGVEAGVETGAIVATEGFDANGSPTSESAFTPGQLVAAALRPDELALIAAAGPGPVLGAATPDDLGLVKLEGPDLPDAAAAAAEAALQEVFEDRADLPQVAIVLEPSPLNENGTINSGFDFWSKRS